MALWANNLSTGEGDLGTATTAATAVDNQVDPQRLAIFSFYILLALITVSGNIIILYAYKRSSDVQSQPFNVFIFHLSIADLLVGVVNWPLKIYDDFTRSATLQSLRLPLLFLASVPIFISLYTVTLMSFDRYQLVSNVFKFMRRTKKTNHMIMMATWVLTICLCVAYSISTFVLVDIRRYFVLRMVLTACMVINFAIPLMILLTLNTLTALKIGRNRRDWGGTNNRWRGSSVVVGDSSDSRGHTGVNTDIELSAFNDRATELSGEVDVLSSYVELSIGKEDTVDMTTRYLPPHGRRRQVGGKTLRKSPLHTGGDSSENSTDIPQLIESDDVVVIVPSLSDDTAAEVANEGRKGARDASERKRAAVYVISDMDNDTTSLPIGTAPRGGRDTNASVDPTPRARLTKNRKVPDPRKAARNLFIFVAVFLVCWMPLSLILLSEFVFDTRNKLWREELSVAFLYGNSAVNPFIYAVMSTRFRKSVIEIFR